MENRFIINDCSLIPSEGSSLKEEFNIAGGAPNITEQNNVNTIASSINQSVGQSSGMTTVIQPVVNNVPVPTPVPQPTPVPVKGKTNTIVIDGKNNNILAKSIR